MRVGVEAVGVLAPGLADWTVAREVLAGQQPYAASPLAPCAPASLPPAERRRSSPTVRLAVACAEQALARTALAARDMAFFFSSAEAAGLVTHQLCEALAGTRDVSPTQFHNSVHNAPSGYCGIAMNAKLGATSVCRGRWSFAAGLLGASALALADDMPVLYVCYDSPMPPPLAEAMPVVEPTAIALVITPPPAPGALAAWEIHVQPVPATDGWPAWMPASWKANASARGFDALATLCAGGLGSAVLPLSPELALRVQRC